MAAALVPPTALVPATLSAGAYVIRNHQVGLVLHVQVARTTPDNDRLYACPQDENRFPSQQIWWIEPLAHHDAAAEHELVYSITCTGSGKALDGSMDPGPNQARGVSTRLWALRTAVDLTSGVPYYTIVNTANNHVLGIRDPGPAVTIQPTTATNTSTRWVFVHPITAFPCGWLELQNAATGNLLSHEYYYNPPTLLPPPTAPVESQYRRQWQFQWALSQHPTSGDRNTWFIVNRLTCALLTSPPGSRANLAWKLERDYAGNWKLVNLATPGMLVQTETNGCCCSVAPSGARGSWILRSPLRFTDAVASCAAGQETS